MFIDFSPVLSQGRPISYPLSAKAETCITTSAAGFLAAILAGESLSMEGKLPSSFITVPPVELMQTSEMNPT